MYRVLAISFSDDVKPSLSRLTDQRKNFGIDAPSFVTCIYHVILTEWGKITARKRTVQ